MTIYNEFLQIGDYNDIQFDLYITLTTSIKESLAKIQVNSLNEAALLTSLNIFTANLQRNIINGTDLIETVNTIFLDSILIGEDSLNNFKFHESLFGFFLKTPFSPSTIVREKAAINIALFQQSVNVYAFSNALINIATVIFSTSEEIAVFIKKISDQYNVILESNRFEKLDGTFIDLVSIFPTVSNLVDTTLTLLSASEASLPKEQLIQIARESLLSLTFRYDGSVDLRQELAKINNLTSPFNLTGDFKVIAQ